MAKRKKTFPVLIIIIIGLLLYDYYTGWQYGGEYIPFLKEDKKKSSPKKNKRKKTGKKKKIKGQKKNRKTLYSTPVYEDIKGDFYQIYFSQVYEGDSNKARENPNSIDKKLSNILLGAKKQIYAAIQDLKSKTITDALLHAHNNGVEVKIVAEDTYTEDGKHERKSFLRLKDAGIPIVDDSRKSKKTGRLMHDKFIVIDGEKVWTGSLNPTDNGCFKNNNNSILIHSPKLAENFIDEFKEMFFDHKFGKSSPKRIKNPKLEFSDGTIVRTLFAPENSVADVLTAEIKKAKKSIYFMAFSFTHDKMGMAMIDKYGEGVQVKGIFEKRGSKTQHSEYGKMKKLGLDVKLDTNKAIMHHKVIIIDEKIIITGSFNFSKNANKRNDENVLIIENPEIARAFIDEFRRLFEPRV